MSWWGKVIGGAFGYMVGGPLGAILGAALGHNFDQGVEGIDTGRAGNWGRQQRIQTAFFTATFSVMGHICKADGRVSHDEIRTARQVMAHMELGPEQVKAAIALFNEGKRPGFPLDAILHQLRREIGHRLNLKRMFIEIQCIAAGADGIIHPQERKLLIYVSEILGISRYELESLLTSASGGFQRPEARTSLDEAYETLGIKSSARDQEVKKAYRRLMNRHHPDKLVSKGLPEEMVKLATERTTEISKAYERIKEQRGL